MNVLKSQPATHFALQNHSALTLNAGKQTLCKREDVGNTCFRYILLKMRTLLHGMVRYWLPSLGLLWFGIFVARCSPGPCLGLWDIYKCCSVVLAALNMHPWVVLMRLPDLPLRKVVAGSVHQGKKNLSFPRGSAAVFSKPTSRCGALDVTAGHGSSEQHSGLCGCLSSTA